MAQVLNAVTLHGLEAVLVAVELALQTGRVSAEHVLNVLSRLKEPANVLIMPAIHSASISTKLMQVLGGSTVIGPLLVGLTHSVQICPIGAKMSEIMNMAALAAFDINTGP